LSDEIKLNQRTLDKEKCEVRASYHRIQADIRSDRAVLDRREGIPLAKDLGLHEREVALNRVGNALTMSLKKLKNNLSVRFIETEVSSALELERYMAESTQIDTDRAKGREISSQNNGISVLVRST
jgi:hypothetical protein